MSIQHMQWVFDSGPDNGSEMVVLLAIANFANQDGEAWPSMQVVADYTRLEKRSVRRIIRERLVPGGWLKIDDNKARAGCNLYCMMCPDSAQPLRFVRGGTVSPPPPEKGGPGVRGGRTLSAERGDRESSEPLGTIKEPDARDARARDASSASEADASRARLEFLAETINTKRFVPASLCDPGTAQALVDAGLVTKERMREVQLL